MNDNNNTIYIWYIVNKTKEIEPGGCMQLQLFSKWRNYSNSG